MKKRTMVDVTLLSLFLLCSVSAEVNEEGFFLVAGGNVGGQGFSANGASDSNMGGGGQFRAGYRFNKDFALDFGYSGMWGATRFDPDVDVSAFTHEWMPRAYMYFGQESLGEGSEWYVFGGAGPAATQITAGDTSRWYWGAGGTGGVGVQWHLDNGWFFGPEGSASAYFMDFEGQNLTVSRGFFSFKVGYQW